MHRHPAASSTRVDPLEHDAHAIGTVAKLTTDDGVGFRAELQPHNTRVARRAVGRGLRARLGCAGAQEVVVLGQRGDVALDFGGGGVEERVDGDRGEERAAVFGGAGGGGDHGWLHQLVAFRHAPALAV
eukprot:2445972-Rhodomonas_salina.1